MSARTCIVCGRPPDVEHHLTSSRLDPALLLPHCHDHHELIHDDWNTAGVPAKNRNRTDEDEDHPPTFLHGLYPRLRRLALWLGRLDEAGLFQPVAGLLAHGWRAGRPDCRHASWRWMRERPAGGTCLGSPNDPLAFHR
jgi:hypothetical protein